MSIASPVVSVSASDVATFEDCQARYYHGKQGYGDGVLATDHVAGDISLAIHDALMEYHRQAEWRLRSVSTMPEGSALFADLLDKHLARKALSRRVGAVADRLARLDAGLERVARLVVDDMPGWARDPARPHLRLIWAEQPLNHGVGIPAVELRPGYVVRTRPDVIGLRDTGDGACRAVVRDFKAKGSVVDPRVDVGILVRGIWVVREIAEPRCRWFIAGRPVRVDLRVVDLEVVNLGHADSTDFLLQASLTAEELLDHRDRFAGILDRMDAVSRALRADEVAASPGGLCHRWCPFLNRCEPGMDHVAKYVGEDELRARLGG